MMKSEEAEVLYEQLLSVRSNRRSHSEQDFPRNCCSRQGKNQVHHRRKNGCPSIHSPGFIDAHIHIESSMLVPSEFARLAVVHGTVATISDPHEIGNVLGIEGVRYIDPQQQKSSIPYLFRSLALCACNRI